VKYVPPYGITTDPDAHYINGDPSQGIQGSIPPAAAFEEPMREIVAVITKSGIVPDDGDLQQMAEGVRSQFLNYVEDTGSVNALSVACDPPLAAYTKGLPLHVLVKNTNNGPCTINAGAGVVRIKKMNGTDLAQGELPAGCLAGMFYDGTVFQLVNFIGAPSLGPPQVFNVKIPYCVDSSKTPGIITANFTPAITVLAAGDMIAVKIANTNPGPTVMNINAITPTFNLAPNGGGIMLQGDIHVGDVVIFFYDGSNLYFAPNPEINANIQYMCGSGQQFLDVPTALNAIRRKSIGANGYVTLKMIPGAYGNFTVSHPSASRLCIAGTMIGSPPVTTDFAQNGGTPAILAQDAIYNINMLRTRYGTEVRCPYVPLQLAHGIDNTGPGLPMIKDLLITGPQPPPPSTEQWETIGVGQGLGYNIQLYNVSIWGCQAGIYANEGCSVTASNCFFSHNTVYNVVAGRMVGLYYCGLFGGYEGNLWVPGFVFLYYNAVTCSGGTGMTTLSGANAQIWHTYILYSANGLDLYALANSTNTLVQCTVGASSPPWNVQGNLGALNFIGG
jgi:hypothetical protein